MSDSRIYLLVPVLNEAANLPRLFHGIDKFRADRALANRSVTLLLIDDGSSDDTVARAQELSRPFDLDVLRHDRNRGPGAAFGTGFERLHTLLQPQDLVFTMEGDNTSRLETALHMLRRLDEGYDAVLASPYAYGGGIACTSPLRVFLSHGANSFLKGFIGLHGIHTMSSFFRLYRAPHLRRLQEVFGPRIVERNGFESMVELLIKMVLVGVKLSEVEMRLDTSLRAGKSKMKVLRTIRGYFTLLFQCRRWRRQAAVCGDNGMDVVSSEASHESGKSGKPAGKVLGKGGSQADLDLSPLRQRSKSA